MQTPSFDALVIGGGINGLSSLYHLTRRGLNRVGLVERFRLSHGRGSSHGHSRITRSAYVDARYVRLMQRLQKVDWPELEAVAGQRLIHPTPGCFFGSPGGKWESYARAVTEIGADCEVIDLAEARRRFRMFRFVSAVGAVDDRTAAVVAAARTIQALLRLSLSRGAEVLEETKVAAIDATRSPIHVDLEDGRQLITERLIVTAGAWAGDLLPPVRPQLQVARQTVGYFRLAGDPRQFEVGQFPVWGNLGGTPGQEFYGLPSFGQPGIKVARHIVAGADDDPDEVPEEVPEQELTRLEQYVTEEFTAPVEGMISYEHCLYTNTATEDFVIDLHPDSDAIAIGAGFSGHGFKFGPLIGRVLVELVCDGASSIEEFNIMRKTFSGCTDRNTHRPS
ncbi:MAG: N-methyl-L-tryptophan oxidase [Candidatus Latescibacterota bacterium]|nr:N-methyl-L-tryptophan oxidase [Candidatus Latescibacterota bacterium]